MKAIYKRNGRQMDITPNPDGTWKAVDQDGATFKISESTKKRWFKILESAEEKAPVVAPEPPAPASEEAPTVILVEEPAELPASESSAEPAPETLKEIPKASEGQVVFFYDDRIVSKPGAKTTQWEMHFGLLKDGVPVQMMIRDAACANFPRGPVQAYIVDPEGVKAKTYSAKATLEQYFGDAGKQLLETVKKLRREYFRQQKQ